MFLFFSIFKINNSYTLKLCYIKFTSYASNNITTSSIQPTLYTGTSMFGSVPVHLVADIGHSEHIYTHYTYIHTYTERDSKYLVRAYECLCRIYI